MIVCWAVIHIFCLFSFAKSGHSRPEGAASASCENASITTASGTFLKKEKFCSGELIFEDNFDFLDLKTWQHENTLAGGGNWEFQWYTNNRSNSFARNGALYIRPTLTSDLLDESFLSSGTLNIYGGAPADECTNPGYWGCERTGTPVHILNPIRSARLRTVYSFSFKFGKVKVRAKLPAGDWLWPAIWLLPRYNAYGSWPASGEIDLVESRGNRDLFKDGVNIGSEQISSTLHFAPSPVVNAYHSTHFTYNSAPGEGYNNEFHVYEVVWTTEAITFKVDDNEIGTVSVDEGFWKRGKFDEKGYRDNPWEDGSLAAPFDQEFYILINLAVGGISYFPDDAENPGGKPWKNTSPAALTDFWRGRNQWLPTWNLNSTNNSDDSLVVDYVRVYAL